MKKTVLVLFSILMIATMLIGATVSTSAEATDIIPIPDIPAIDRPYKTMEELGIDFEAIDAYFPQEIEIRYDGSKVYVEDIGAGYVNVSTSKSYVLELVDGYWTGDIEGDLQFIYFYPFENFWEDRHWHVVYYEDGTRDPYIHINDDIKGESVNFSYEYGNVTVLYDSGDYSYEDIYSNGVLYTHGVSNRKDTESVEALYDVNGSLAYGKLYTDTYYYYFPGQGWSSTRGSFTAGDAPAGYEDVDETYFTANKPSLVCSNAVGDDIVHDMTKAFCTTLDTCKNGCGYTAGEIEHHTWQTVGGEKVCSVCDAVFFPEFEFVNRVYPTVEETGFPYAEYRVLFPDILTVKYENGKYMIKDVGADEATGSNNANDEEVALTLVDGWWIYEIDEEIYNDESIRIFVTFRGELDFGSWDINYYNGEVNGSIYINNVDVSQSVQVYYYEYDLVSFVYRVGDRNYIDTYSEGVLSLQEVETHFGDDMINIEYFDDGTVNRVYIYSNDEWFYYFQETGWEDDYAPEGYENADIEFLTSLAPTTINCAHKKYSEADCTSPECCLICGIAKDGSKPLGHNYVGEITTQPTCTEKGVKTFTCQNDKTHTYTEDVEIDKNAHNWNEGEITTETTCTETGVKTFTCQHDKTHTYTEDIDALGHSDGGDDADGLCDGCWIFMGDTIDIGEVLNVTTRPLTYTYIKFTPEADGEYIIVSRADNLLPTVTLNSETWEGLGNANWSTGGGNNFRLPYHFEAGKTYIIGLFDYAAEEGATEYDVEIIVPCTEHTGGNATCIEQAICEICYEAYGELAKHTGGNATCTEQAVCDICGEAYGELAEHEADDIWRTNETHHYHLCIYWTEGGICQERVDYGEHADTDNNGKCDACDYQMSAGGSNSGGSSSGGNSSDGTDPDDKNDRLSGGAIAGIAVGSCTAAGLGGFSIFWFVIKKKKWSDLAGIFK